jgi:hypothetical protein
MLQAAAALKLSPDRRVPPETIREYLSDNWPSNFGIPSKHMLNNMTTLLRRPQDGKGGNHKWHPTATSADEPKP